MANTVISRGSYRIIRKEPFSPLLLQLSSSAGPKTYLSIPPHLAIVNIESHPIIHPLGITPATSGPNSSLPPSPSPPARTLESRSQGRRQAVILSIRVISPRRRPSDRN